MDAGRWTLDGASKLDGTKKERKKERGRRKEADTGRKEGRRKGGDTLQWEGIEELKVHRPQLPVHPIIFSGLIRWTARFFNFNYSESFKNGKPRFFPSPFPAFYPCSLVLPDLPPSPYFAIPQMGPAGPDDITTATAAPSAQTIGMERRLQPDIGTVRATGQAWARIGRGGGVSLPCFALHHQSSLQFPASRSKRFWAITRQT